MQIPCSHPVDVAPLGSVWMMVSHLAMRVTGKSSSVRGWLSIWLMNGVCSLNQPQMVISNPKEGLMHTEKVPLVMSLYTVTTCDRKLMLANLLFQQHAGSIVVTGIG